MGRGHSITYHAVVSTNRRYRSTLREERTQETRLRIRTAARELFAASGFSETTVTQIADRAGVAPQTVYSVFGSKGGIVTSMLEDIEESSDREAWIARLRAEQDPHRQLRLFVSWIRSLFEQGAPILRAALSARSDTDVADLADRGDDHRRNGTRELTKIWAQLGALREDLEPEEAAQRLWLLTSFEQYLLAIDTLDWDADRYESWLADLLEREILRSG